MGEVPAHVLAKSETSKVDPSLVNPILPGTDANDGEPGSELFKDLLPSEIQVAVAMFKSRITDMLERATKIVTEKEDEIKQALQGANLPAAIEAGGGEYTLTSSLFLPDFCPGGAYQIQRGPKY